MDKYVVDLIEAHLANTLDDDATMELMELASSDEEIEAALLKSEAAFAANLQRDQQANDFELRIVEAPPQGSAHVKPPPAWLAMAATFVLGVGVAMFVGTDDQRGGGLSRSVHELEVFRSGDTQVVDIRLGPDEQEVTLLIWPPLDGYATFEVGVDAFVGRQTPIAEAPDTDFEPIWAESTPAGSTAGMAATIQRELLPPGAYRIVVRGVGENARTPVHTVFFRVSGAAE